MVPSITVGELIDITGAASSLVRVMAVPATVISVSVPSMVIVSSISWKSSSFGVRIKVVYALAVLAGMVMVWPVTSS